MVFAGDIGNYGGGGTMNWNFAPFIQMGTASASNSVGLDYFFVTKLT